MASYAHPDHIPLWRQTEFISACAIILGVTALRALVVIMSPFNLGPDEAQYWDWSRELAFGYYSKPPMIAWLIRLETTVCGDGEACIRILSPLLHGITSLGVFGLARALFGGRVALWSSLAYLTLPAVSFAAGIMSTDLPLLFFWTLGLWALQRFLKVGSIVDAAALGLLIGLGLLSKYAMIYFIVCLAVFLTFSPQDRWILKSPKLSLSAALAGLVVLPNIVWNANNGFSTVRHTGDNANLDVDLFNLDSLFKFLGDQFGLMGPAFFPLFIIAALAAFGLLRIGRSTDRNFVFLASFSLPIVVIITAQSFLSRANANWAATAYAAGAILTVAWLMKRKWYAALYGSLALHAAIGLFLYVLILFPPMIQTVGLGNAFKRVQGWPDLARQVEQIAEDIEAQTILTEDRLILTELLYYTRELPLQFRIWDYNGYPESHYELKIPYEGTAKEPLLLVARNKNPKPILRRFETGEFIATISVTVSVNPSRSRELHLYRVERFRDR